MRNLELSWQQAAILAGCMVALTILLRLARRPRLTAAATFTRETALVLVLFALWQFAGSFSVMRPGGALARSRWIWHHERVTYLPSETSVQRLFLPHPLIVQALNLYYDVLHFPVLIACLIWLWVRHRARYIRARTALVGFTAACLLIQLIPVAPPRMLPGTGLVDTAVLYHQSVYQTHTGFDADQLSAMPSVHVGWAILVAIMVITAARSPWRWLALLYPVATTLAVVVTANHFWLDGIVAGLVLLLVLLVQHAVTRAVARYRYMWLLPYRPVWDHRGISSRRDDPPSTPRRGANSAIRNGDPAGTGGSNGRNGSAADRERAPARCDRSS